MSKQIGDDIRSLRKSQNMTLVDLASSLGRSIGWLSQIERGKTTPSIRDLSKIAQTFDLNTSFFFRSASQNEDERGIVVRHENRVPIGSAESGLVEELLSPYLSGSFEIVKSIFAPNSESKGNKNSKLREDGGIVIEGELVLTIGSKELKLRAGDSFQFEDKDYGWRNESDKNAIVIWVISPPVY